LGGKTTTPQSIDIVTSIRRLFAGSKKAKGDSKSIAAVSSSKAIAAAVSEKAVGKNKGKGSRKNKKN